MIRAGKHSMDAALGNMTKRMRGDQDKIVDLSNGDGENKPLKGNLMNTYTHARTHTCIWLHTYRCQFRQSKSASRCLTTTRERTVCSLGRRAYSRIIWLLTLTTYISMHACADSNVTKCQGRQPIQTRYDGVEETRVRQGSQRQTGDEPCPLWQNVIRECVCTSFWKSKVILVSCNAFTSSDIWFPYQWDGY